MYTFMANRSTFTEDLQSLWINMKIESAAELITLFSLQSTDI